MVSQILLLALRAYKILLSGLFTGSCRFLPSCSDYAGEAIRTHGPMTGGLMAARRLCRCHPFAAAGHDPVPPRPDTATTLGTRC